MDVEDSDDDLTDD